MLYVPDHATLQRHTGSGAKMENDDGNKSAQFGATDQNNHSQAAPAVGSLNQYSCLPCRGRKRKCDRVFPCVNCQRNGLECVFVSRRPSTRQPPSVALQERVRNLEALVSRMRHHLDLATGQTIQSSYKAAIEEDMPTAAAVTKLGDSFGRLTVENGRSRYVANNSWASLEDEVEDLESLLYTTNEEHTEHTFSTTHTSILGFGTPFHGLTQMHPPPDQVAKYLELFKMNCDPLIKVLHMPTIEPLILQASQKGQPVAKGLEALMMAIYYAAIGSLSTAQCVQRLGAERPCLLKRFQLATEHALARVGLLETNEMATLQAFTIFLITLRSHTSPRAMSTLTALLVRLAQNCGIHRDGTHFKLSPFVVEMRRRLWWAICVLDSRACEDTGYESAIALKSADTKFPLNVNDTDLTSNMKHLPPSTSGVTEMTFSVVRFESTEIFRRIQGVSWDESDLPTGLDEKKAAIKKEQARIEWKYFNALDLSDPYSWYTWAISRIVFTKMWLVTYHPFLMKEGRDKVSPDIRDWLFDEATQALKHWLSLNEQEATRRWKWLCETYIQWYALTFLLSELRYRMNCEKVSRAWDAIDASLHLGLVIHSTTCEAARADLQNVVNITEASCQMYRPLLKLYKSALAARYISDQGAGAALLKSSEEPFLQVPPSTISDSDVLDITSAANSIDFFEPIPTTWPLETTQLCPFSLLEDKGVLANQHYAAAPWMIEPDYGNSWN